MSVEAQALAWARQDDAPNGAVVTADHEIVPRGLHGRLWAVRAESTFACAIVLRPPLQAEACDMPWLVAGIGAATGAELVAGRRLSTWWPDLIVDPGTGHTVGAIRADVHLGPGRVQLAVVTIRLDLQSLGLDQSHRDDLLHSVLEAFADGCTRLQGDADSTTARYNERCTLLGRRVKVALLPNGEARGVARTVDGYARLELASPTGMLEHITVDMFDRLELA